MAISGTRLRTAVERHPLRAITAGVVVAAVVARVSFVAVYGPHLGADSYYYIGRAQELLARGPQAIAGIDPVAAPLYPLFLAVVAAALPLDVTGAAMVGQVLLGCLTAALLVRITYRLAGSLVAVGIAGAIASVHISFLFWGAYVLSEVLFLFVLALSVDRLIVLERSRGPVLDSFLAAVCVVAAALTRPNAAPFALVVPVYLWLASRGDRPRLLRSAAGLAGACLVVLLAIGAVQASRPGYDLAVRVENYVWSAVYIGLQWTEQGRATGGVDLVRELKADSYREAVLEWIAADPTHFFLQAGRKLKVFWSPVLPEFSLRHAAVNLAYYVPFYLLALNGTRLLRRQRAPLALLLVGVASFTVTSMVTFVDYDQRYRLPAELLLIPLAGIGASPLVRDAQRLLAKVSARRRERPAG